MNFAFYGEKRRVFKVEQTEFKLFYIVCCVQAIKIQSYYKDPTCPFITENKQPGAKCPLNHCNSRMCTSIRAQQVWNTIATKAYLRQAK